MEEHNETIYMDAVLSPNRSLSPRAFTVIMIGFGTISFMSGIAFLLAGAIPVVGFLGLDVLLFYAAFRWTFRQQTESTRVTITARNLHLHHQKANGETKTVSLPSAFSRVELDDRPSPNSWLRIEYGRKAYVIGRFLTFSERKSLAKALRQALVEARSERHFVR